MHFLPTLSNYRVGSPDCDREMSYLWAKYLVRRHVMNIHLKCGVFPLKCSDWPTYW